MPEILLISGTCIAFLIIIDFAMSFGKYQNDLSFWENKLKAYETEIMETQYGKIEFLRTGEGIPILVSHGINGGQIQP